MWLVPRKFDLNVPSSSIKTASIAQMGSKIINVIVQLVITMVLARLLTPAEYGTVAVLTAFAGIFSILADGGIAAAIVQSQDLDEDDYRRLFFLSLLIGIVLTLGFCALSVGVAWFYGDAVYVPLGCLMSLGVLFNSLNMVPNGMLIKERKYNLIAVRLVVCTTVVGAVAILLAFLGFGCYAIVMNTVLTSLFILLWNLAGTRLKMSAGDVRGVVRKVGSFSAFNLGSSLIGWFANNADSLIVGKLFGAEELGYYNKAYNLYAYPLNILTIPITSTLLPFLAPLQGDRDALYRKFMGIFRRISFLSALCTAWMSVCAAEVIVILYGETWVPAIPLLTTLSFAVYSRGINGSFGALLTAKGRSDLLMLSTGVNTVVTVGMIALGGVMGSVESLATCVSIAYNLEIIAPALLCSKKCLDMGFWRFFSRLVPDIVSVLAVIGLSSLIPWDIQNVFLSASVKTLFVGCAMVGIRVLLGELFWREGISTILPR
ncbi:MAG: Lipopolysaccharide biosynthesis protein [Atopobium sp.]